jgi:hypothetical protein
MKAIFAGHSAKQAINESDGPIEAAIGISSRRSRKALGSRHSPFWGRAVGYQEFFSAQRAPAREASDYGSSPTFAMHLSNTLSANA